jgi:hypothetical protein
MKVGASRKGSTISGVDSQNISPEASHDTDFSDLESHPEKMLYKGAVLEELTIDKDMISNHLQLNLSK